MKRKSKNLELWALLIIFPTLILIGTGIKYFSVVFGPVETIRPVSQVRINIAELDYDIDIGAFQSIGFFRQESCSQCDFSEFGRGFLITDDSRAELLIELFRHPESLYISIYGEDREVAVMSTRELLYGLRMQFPTSADAFALVDLETSNATIPREQESEWFSR